MNAFIQCDSRRDLAFKFPVPPKFCKDSAGFLRQGSVSLLKSGNRRVAAKAAMPICSSFGTL